MNALVTGASSGLGKEIYEWLKFDYYRADEAWNILGTSRRGPDIEVDLGTQTGRNFLVKHLVDYGKNIDILVNNAGILKLVETPIDYQDLFEVNLITVWELIENLFGLLRLNRGARIINIASVAGIKGEEDFPLYAATKAGVISLTKSYAKKLAPMDIRVNCISPGLFDTNLVEGEPPKELIESIPFKREASCHEIIPVVKMLLECEYMTGSNIVVDGGYLL
jgi:3-oxoacyl-[acyl-carrier protein] reductase